MIPADIRVCALGVAACDADHRVRETGGNNKGPRIRAYMQNLDPPMPDGLAWCAAAVQYWFDLAARTLGQLNPLDAVRHEALVLSYYEQFADRVVRPHDARPGDLVLMKFGGNPRAWDHIGLLAQELVAGSKGFFTIEGNTSDENQREGDVVAYKPRELDAGYPVLFIDPRTPLE